MSIVLRSHNLLFKNIKADLKTARKNDPSCRSYLEVLLTYSGVRALWRHRIAHFFFQFGLKTFARIISYRTKRITGIEIHPGAQIAPGVFIDHGQGTVIGETTVIGTGTIIYQGCTFGATGKSLGKRHPNIGENCVISAGAIILGNINVGNNAKVGAGAVVLNDVPENSTVVGVPAKVVRLNGKKVNNTF